MKARVSFNYKLLPAENSFISAVSSAALYGRGVFTTVAVYHGKAFLWDKHWLRLKENSARFGIELRGHAESDVKAALNELVARNDLRNGRARLTFFDESPSAIWNADGAQTKTSLFITTGEFLQTKDAYQLTVSPFAVNSKSPLAGVKSCNYMENLLALEEAKARGFDEAIRLNERGEIVSAAMANVFWAKGERIFTPPPNAGCLMGTTRALVLENFPVEEKLARIEELRDADEIFLTSAGIGIKSVRAVEEKSFNSEIAQKIRRVFDRYAKSN